MCGTCGCKSAETLSKTSCCCGADEANPCACMKAPEPMNCSAKAPKCACYKALEKNAEFLYFYVLNEKGESPADFNTLEEAQTYVANSSEPLEIYERRSRDDEAYKMDKKMNAEYDEEDMVYCKHCSDIVGNEKEVYGDETVEYEMANGELVCLPCYKIWMKEYKNDLDPHYSPFYAETFEARDNSWCVNHGWIRGGTKIGDIIPCSNCNDMICDGCRCGGCGNCNTSDCCECSHNQAAETFESPKSKPLPYIIDGKRRLATWKEIAIEQKKEYDYKDWVEADKQIDYLNGIYEYLEGCTDEEFEDWFINIDQPDMSNFAFDYKFIWGNTTDREERMNHFEGYINMLRQEQQNIFPDSFYEAETFEAEDGDDCPSCANACKHDDSNKIKVESIYDYEVQSPSNMVIQVTCLDCGESGTFYADDVDWHGEKAKLRYSPQIAVNMMNPTFGDLKCSRCHERFQMAAEKWGAETFEATIVHQGKVPDGAIGKAMLNQSMITQASIEATINELENKVNLGLISEKDLMDSLKKKFGAEYDIEVHSSEENKRIKFLKEYFAKLKAKDEKLAKQIEYRIKSEMMNDERPSIEPKIIEAGFDPEIIQEWVEYYAIDEPEYEIFERCSSCEGDGEVMIEGSYWGGDRYDPPEADFKTCDDCFGSGLIDPSDYMYGGDDEIEYMAEYGYDHIECGKCGGNHKGYCPDYGKEEDEYIQCTDCKWDGANGNWNTVIEWCSSCKEKNEIEAKRNAELIRLDKERKEQEEQDRMEQDNYDYDDEGKYHGDYYAESFESQGKPTWAGYCPFCKKWRTIEWSKKYGKDTVCAKIIPDPHYNSGDEALFGRENFARNGGKWIKPNENICGVVLEKKQSKNAETFEMEGMLGNWEGKKENEPVSCSNCKWDGLESDLAFSGGQYSHRICPECKRKDWEYKALDFEAEAFASEEHNGDY